jgi:hypothetical protein
MLARPPKPDAKPAPSAAAVRARRSRALRSEGIVILRLRMHRKRLVAAMRCANPGAGDLATTAQVEAELQALVDAFIVRWLGKK